MTLTIVLVIPPNVIKIVTVGQLERVNQLAVSLVLALNIKGPPSAVKIVPIKITSIKSFINNLGQAPIMDNITPILIL